MKITEYRAYEILCWLDDQAGDHTNLFEQMTLYRDAAALIRQLRDDEQSAWHAGMDAGRELGRGKERAGAKAAEIEALRAEVERLNRYYKNGIDCFANPCEKHSGERTPPFSEFFEKYGGQCLICVVDNNKALQAEIEALLSDLADYMRIANAEATRADRLAEAKDAEIEALRVDVEAWKASHSMLTDTCHHFQARAKRLAEALREMREYVTAALQDQREAFAGHEDSSDIPGIEADLHKIDTLLREQENDDA